MADDKAKGPNIPWPAVVTTLAVIGGLFWYWAPLKSSRPPVTAGRPMRNLGEQDVEARLWQDPLAAADAHRAALDAAAEKGKVEQPETELHSLYSIQHAIARQAAPGPSPSPDPNNALSSPTSGPAATIPALLVLPVMIEGGPHAYQAERRLRTRSAVLAGLAASGFTPSDGERLGYFTVQWTRRYRDGKALEDPAFWAEVDAAAEAPQGDKSTRAASSEELLVPFEWCKARFDDPQAVMPRGTRHVLILWLRDEMFNDSPLRRLASLVRILKVPDNPAIAVTVLGPATSGTMRPLLEEAAKGLGERTRASIGRARILGYSSTVSEAMLQHRLPLGEARLEGLWEACNGAPTAADLVCYAVQAGGSLRRDVPKQFARTIPTDDAVCDELVRELERRGVQAGSESDNVAIVSEWDTFYGRALPMTFLSAAAKAEWARPARAGVARGDFPTSEELARRQSNEWRGIHSYSYLRGIDGRLPGEQAKSKEASDEKKDAKPSRPVEQPEGLDQSDYLRRLAQRLVELDRQLKMEGHKGGLRAVGILGSDIYDKLMVLRALRGELPGALFFTNNLDVRLSHASEWDATHNLIVASSFGLQLGEEFQRNIPPFRDAYQTAAFATTLMATGAAPTPMDPNQNPPRLFEIGKSGPYDLSMRRGPITTLPDRARPGWWTKQRRDAFIWCVVTLALLVGGFLYTFALKMTPCETAHGVSQAKRWFGFDPLLQKVRKLQWIQLLANTPCFVVLGGTFVVALVWRLYRSQRHGGEPLLFFEGISIWPSVGISIFAGLLCFHFLIRAYCAMRCNDQDVEREFDLYLSAVDGTSIARGTGPGVGRVGVGGNGSGNGAAQANTQAATLPVVVPEPGTRQPARARTPSKHRGAGASDPPQKTANAHHGPVASPSPAGATASSRTGDLEHAIETGRQPRQNLAPVDPSAAIPTVLPGSDVNSDQDKDPDRQPVFDRPGARGATPADPSVPGRNRSVDAGEDRAKAGDGTGKASDRGTRNDGWMARAPRLFHNAKDRALSWTASGRWLFKELKDQLLTWDVWPIRSDFSPSRVNALLLWQEYHKRGRVPMRIARIIPVTLIYLVFGWYFLDLAGGPSVPYRGSVSERAAFWSTAFVVIASILLTFYVVDATRLNEHFIRFLTDDITDYSRETRSRYRRNRRKLEGDDLADYLDIELIAKRTDVVGKFIYYPFIVLTLMILSRLSYFDNWDWPVALVILLSVNALYAIWAAWCLRRAAEAAREQVLTRLRDRQVTCLAHNKTGRAAAIKELIEDVKSKRVGAFAPLTQHPILGAFLLPSSGIGVWAAVQYLLP